MKIVPKLYLNNSPQTAEEGSIVYARNMKVDIDDNIVNDYGYTNYNLPQEAGGIELHIVGHIVGNNNKIYLFCYDETHDVSKIYVYDEIAETINAVATNKWTYSGDGARISGTVSLNNVGNEILTIAEVGSKNVPLKHINLSYADVSDESLYTQAPKIPIANLIFNSTYPKTIPSGVYVFFVRYKIRENVYTGWHLCSRPVFAGTSEQTNTIQGGLKFINTHKDSAKSFIFDFEVVNNTFNDGTLNWYDLYSECQFGFIITHDEATDARIWKSFNTSDLNQSGKIYFDYNNVEEANIDELLETTYDIYNVDNVINYKNKLYISNYKESDFNDNDAATAASIITINAEECPTQDSIKNKVIVVDSQGESSNADYNYNLGLYPLPDGFTVYKELFDISASELSKGDSIDVEDAVTFELKLDQNEDPDIASIFNIQTKLVGYKVFGEGAKDYSHTAYVYLSTNLLWTKEVDGVGISTHPWYNLGFTFAYVDDSNNGNPEDKYKVKKIYFVNNKSGVTQQTSTPGEYERKWYVYDNGIDEDNRGEINTNIKKEISDVKLFKFAYFEIYSGATVYKVVYDINKDLDEWVSNIDGFDYEHDFKDKTYRERLSVIAYEYIIRHTSYIDSTGSPVIYASVYDETTGQSKFVTVACTSIGAIFHTYEFKVSDVDDIRVDTLNYHRKYHVEMKKVKYTSIVNFMFKSDKMTIDNNYNFEQSSTLMPFSTYKAYIHLVDEHGIIQDGIECRNNITTEGISQNTNIYKLNYKIIDDDFNALADSIRNKWKAFFISIVNVGDTYIECFAYKHYKGYHILQCIECDSLLYNLNNNITIVYSTDNIDLLPATTTAAYYSSGSFDIPLSFGNCGFIAWKDNHNYSNDYRFYVKLDNKNDGTTNVNYRLVKATPYIEFNYTEDAGRLVVDGYYGSYFCAIKKPDFYLSANAFVSGNDIYSVNRDSIMKLTEFKSYIQIQSSPIYFLRSNFNLNYLSLTEDISSKIVAVGNASSGLKQVANTINSTNLNYIYELKSMYKDFSNKYFQETRVNAQTEFNNTIRVSNVLSDESSSDSLFNFRSTDYYNIPANRGKIIKLFAIGNVIYAHTRHSLFKFDGNQTIVGNERDIALQESEVFSTGVTSVFDSEFGYGGIKEKSNGCITFDAYFFYNSDTHHIFMFGGAGDQISVIDGSIYKFLLQYDVFYCNVIHDIKNNRVLFGFIINKNGTEATITLSYNYKDKAFISFHDLTLVNAFNSGSSCYSYYVRNKYQKLFESNVPDVTVVDNETKTFKIYGEATRISNILFKSKAENAINSNFTLCIILPAKQYYNEVLNYLSYTANINENDITKNAESYDTLSVINVNRTSPVSHIEIITDACISNVIDSVVDDTQRPNSLLQYQGIKFDKNQWNINYFRDSLHNIDVYKYKGGADNKSLIYGRFFIVHFDFINNARIKIEDIFINTNRY